MKKWIDTAKKKGYVVIDIKNLEVAKNVNRFIGSGLVMGYPPKIKTKQRYKYIG